MFMNVVDEAELTDYDVDSDSYRCKRIAERNS